MKFFCICKLFVAQMIIYLFSYAESWCRLCRNCANGLVWTRLVLICQPFTSQTVTKYAIYNFLNAHCVPTTMTILMYDNLFLAYKVCQSNWWRVPRNWKNDQPDRSECSQLFGQRLRENHKNDQWKAGSWWCSSQVQQKIYFERWW